MLLKLPRKRGRNINEIEMVFYDNEHDIRFRPNAPNIRAENEIREENEINEEIESGAMN